MVAGLVVAAVLFGGTMAVLQPATTAETLIIRTTAFLAFLLLHFILCIGPLARLDARFAPLLYNRRHLGVTLFLVALIHGAISTIQFHALGDMNPLVSLFTAYGDDYWVPVAGLAHVPFEPFGVLALIIFFVMAATSHDFWLQNLGPAPWKALHVLVYLGYGAVLVHVLLGSIQKEHLSALPALVAVGFVSVVGLHLAAGLREKRRDIPPTEPTRDGYVLACSVSQLKEGCGHTVFLGKERVALFLKEQKVFALSNVCRHQGGPLGEGKILDGCVTCPWHGWNYKPEDGCSPPPFEETVPTYPVRIHEGKVYVHPEANPLKTSSEGAVVDRRQETP
jgi:nitrite reductase/ring-hydroxylating ferredoxin subunit/DMSO/TMAO reductase YedYZ heme-binding membrane subunit